MWAFCYRKYIGLNTNMHLENLHKRLKHLYLDGIRCSRLDSSINALFMFIRDTMYERMIKIAKNKPTDKMKQIFESHKKSLDLAQTVVNTENVDGRLLYSIKSENFPHKSYLIEKFEEKCASKFCVLQCKDCNVCVHTFKCSCPDNVIYLNICKHIHKVGQHLSTKDEMATKAIVPSHVGQNLIAETQQFLPTEINKKLTRKGKTLIKNRLELMLARIDEADIDDNDIRMIEKKLNGALKILSKRKINNLQRREFVNSRRKIQPQRRRTNLVRKKKTSTKKKPPLLSKPSQAELSSCIQSLQGQPSINIIHSNNDHSYN